VRYESATQTVVPVQVFKNAPVLNAATALDNDYWLPAATLTWSATPELQIRLSGSQTIARPQFRELIYQPFYDPDTSRTYVGNPLLVDSKLTNGEARAEWYFAPDQRLSVSGFYKKIDRPIEAFVYALSGASTTSYANAPQAQLYGAEIEAQKYFDSDDLGFLPQDRRIVIIANYTYTKSKLQVNEGDTTNVYGVFDNRATSYFRDGAPLTGQSDHLVNLQLGLENPDRLSQMTLLLSYASERVVSRGLTGIPPQPDVVEQPGFNLDFVVREGFTLFGHELEAKVEVRNILGTRHHEFQQTATDFVNVNTYDVGTTFSGSLSFTF
jgi:outer membrane receptor protein involved in Fe transport